MKQKYALNIADIQLNVVADTDPAQVAKISGILDRKMREYYLSSRHCTKNEAALLCALEFCSERLEYQARATDLEALNSKYEEVLTALRDRNEVLNQDLERALSENRLLRSLITTKVSDDAGTGTPAPEEAPAAKEEEEDPTTKISASAFFAEVASATEGRETAKPDPKATDPVAQALAEAIAHKDEYAIPHAAPSEDNKGRTRRGGMFDLLSFDEE